MSNFRYPADRDKDQKIFSKSADFVHERNYRCRPLRGGIRL